MSNNQYTGRVSVFNPETGDSDLKEVAVQITKVSSHSKAEAMVMAAVEKGVITEEQATQILA